MKRILLKLRQVFFQCQPTRLNASFKIGFSLAIVVGLSPKASSAETILINYGPLEFSLSIESIEEYVTQGELTPELASYTEFLDQQQLDQLRQILMSSADLSAIAVSQFFYSPQGEVLLEQIGQVVQTSARQSGFYALRSALILAAADEQGLTALNVLKKFPSETIRVDTGRGLEIFQSISGVIEETQAVLSIVQNESRQELIESSILNFGDLPNLGQPGTIAFTRQTLTLTDSSRDRTIPVDLYLPQLENQIQLPVVVISHGLGSDRSTFAYLAQHLATYGYAVAVPEHPGSSASQLQALLEGFASQVTPPGELIDRPLDIQFLLDRLEVLYGQQLNLRDVGVVGQSFGGYTALALAGASLNFERLEQECQLNEFVNISLLLQCLALELPQVRYNLRDERIGAAIAINPLTSRIFGSQEISQIDIPVMLVAGSADAVTPALPEQIRPFTWLENPEKYLVLLQGGTHFSVLSEDESVEAVPVPEQAIGPAPELAREYLQVLGVAFFNTYVAEESDYQAFLSAGYARSLSQSSLPIYLIESLEAEL